MIAALEWVPAGVADENPKKYEMNSAEKEVLQMLQDQPFECRHLRQPRIWRKKVSTKRDAVEACQQIDCE